MALLMELLNTIPGRKLTVCCSMSWIVNPFGNPIQPSVAAR